MVEVRPAHKHLEFRIPFKSITDGISSEFITSVFVPLFVVSDQSIPISTNKYGMHMLAVVVLTTFHELCQVANHILL